ncbi:TPA: secretin [Vibrio vulnificus]|nr:secretin [Vibrio vulnificus]
MIPQSMSRKLGRGTILLGTGLMYGCTMFQPMPENKTPTPPTNQLESSYTLVEQQSVQKPEHEISGTTAYVGDNIRKAPLLRAGQGGGDVVQQLSLPTEKLSLNADRLPLNNFINLALGEVLKTNYIVDQELADKAEPVTLRVNNPVSAQRLLGLVEEVLQVNGIAMVLDDQLIKVIPANKAGSQAPRLLSQSVKPLLKYGKTAQIIPVYYLPLSQATTMAEKMLRESGGGSVLMQNHLNSMMVVAQQTDINRIRDMLQQLDVPNRASSHMTLIQSRYMTSRELSSRLQNALASASVPVSMKSGNNGVVLNPLSDQQLLVTASTRAWLNYAEEWIKRIDIPAPVEGSQGVYAYFMQNTKAEDAWQVVQTIFAGKEAKANEQANNNNQNILQGARDSADGVTPGNTGMKNLSNNRAQGLSVVDDNFRVVIDTKRNALIFQGEYQDYQRLVNLLKFVDQRPRQVLLQATVAEVSLTDSYSLGFDISTTGGDITGGTKGLAEAGVLSLKGVFGDFEVGLEAALENGRAQILSSPRIIALDQESARINIGNQIQVKSGEVSGGGDDSKATITYKYIDIGITLDITPTINQNGVIELNISQEVSSQGASTGDSPTINTRSLQTKLLADSGESVYMGGLISTDNTSKEKKVPVLGDIPVLGNLFKFTKEEQTTSELVLMITPYVISSREEAKFYTNEFKDVTGWQMMGPRFN